MFVFRSNVLHCRQYFANDFMILRLKFKLLLTLPYSLLFHPKTRFVYADILI